MRKFLLAALALFVSVGLTLAAQVTFLGYDKDKKELKVKDGDKEKTLKVIELKNAPRVSDIVRNLNAIGATSSDLIAILEALKQAGALHARVKVI